MTHQIRALATAALSVLCLAPTDAAAQRGRQVVNKPHPPIVIGAPSKEPQGSRAARARASVLDTIDTKAATGRIEQQDDNGYSPESRGQDIWNAYGRQLQKRMQLPLSSFQYNEYFREEFKKTWKSDLEASIYKEAGNRGHLIFTGRSESGNSLVKLQHPYDSSKYTPIFEEDVARGTLYLPYLVGMDIPLKANKPVTKATAPLVAIDDELFWDQMKDGTIHHHEFLLNPRADLRSYEITDTKPIQLRPIESRQLEFKPGIAEPATIAKLLGCCVYVRPPMYTEGKLVKFLKTMRFDVDHLRIALMVHDSATQSHLAGDLLLSGQGRAEAINRATKDIEPWVVSQLKKASGGTLLLLGHVEGKDYVVRDSIGVEAGRIPVQRANELALQHKVTLFNLGCKTADTLRDHDGIGVYDAFNSIHMLRSISTALHSGPKTIADFLERLATPEARIVIPASIMARADLVAAVKDLRDPVGRKVVEGKRLRIPAIQPIVSPNGRQKGFPRSLSVLLTSARQNERGFFPVIAELHVVLDACRVLAAAKKLQLDGSDNLTCEQYRDAPYIPVITHLYGDPERKLH